MSEAVNAFFKKNFNVIMRDAKSGVRERKYEQVKIQESFDKFDRERKKKRLLLIEYHKETRKKLIENQYKLKGIIKKIKEGIEALDREDSDEAKGLLKKIEVIEESGEYQDILKIVETSKTDSFREFRELIAAQNKETQLLKIESRKDLAGMSEADLQKTIAELNQQLKVIEEQRKEYDEFNRDIEDLEATHVILNGLKRGAILNVCRYYEIQTRFGQGLVVHPESLDVLAEVQYKVENNLPVKKELLYEVAPGLFSYEVEQLAPLKRAELQGRFDRMVSFSETALVAGFDNKQGQSSGKRRSEEAECSSM